MWEKVGKKHRKMLDLILDCENMYTFWVVPPLMPLSISQFFFRCIYYFRTRKVLFMKEK